MTDLDYKKINFKCGLEIHQQLEGSKLFCGCRTLNYRGDDNGISIFRKLHVSESEMGDVDAAAQYEKAKNRVYHYIGNPDDVCLVDIDEEPPRDISASALYTVLQFAKLVHATVAHELQVMRKMVVDGSNVSGFQRTMLVAMNGYVETSKGKVAIDTICLEEEACQKVSATEHEVTYRLDRLGIPLIEVATDASIQDAEHAQETAAIIGELLRCCSNVKRGLGSIRQDVNVSVQGKARVEIKGFQEIKSMPKIITHEAQRHLDLYAKGETLEPHVRKAEADFTTSFLRPMPGSARMYPETDVRPHTITTEFLDSVALPENTAELARELAAEHNVKEQDVRELFDSGVDPRALLGKFKQIGLKELINIFLVVPKDLKSRKKLATENLTQELFSDVAKALDAKNIAADAIPAIYTSFIENGAVDIKQFEQVSDKELEKAIAVLLKKEKDKPRGFYVGQLMAQFKGRASGKKVNELLSKLLK